MKPPILPNTAAPIGVQQREADAIGDILADIYMMRSVGLEGEDPRDPVIQALLKRALDETENHADMLKFIRLNRP